MVPFLTSSIVHSENIQFIPTETISSPKTDLTFRDTSKLFSPKPQDYMIDKSFRTKHGEIKINTNFSDKG
jgi:hypothetical protein